MTDLSIGNVKLNNPFLLAPLAGITDAVMRRICSRMGASLTFSEMVSAKAMWYGDKNTEKLLALDADGGPTAYQIFGHEPEVMAAAARKLEGMGNVIVDINMGCPVPKVVKNGDGSALLKDPDLAYQVAKSVVTNTSKPVTVKIRAGWDVNSINAVEIAHAVSAAGVSAIAIHGRTREQYYSGKADRSIIADVKKAVDIPVIGNGDVFSAEDGMEMLNQTGCDFVLVARGSLGNPWIFRELTALWKGQPIPERPTTEEKKHMMTEHYLSLEKLKGEYVAVREMRKQVGWYLKGVPGAAAFRGMINQINSSKELLEAIERI